MKCKRCGKKFTNFNYMFNCSQYCRECCKIKGRRKLKMKKEIQYELSLVDKICIGVCFLNPIVWLLIIIVKIRNDLKLRENNV